MNEWISEGKDGSGIRIKGREDYGKRGTSVPLRLVLYTCSIGHLRTSPVEKSSKQLDIRLEAPQRSELEIYP